MNDLDQDPLEQELRRLRPAQPPAELMDRLREAHLGTVRTSQVRGAPPLPVRDWARLVLRIWIPAAAAGLVVVAGLVLTMRKPAPQPAVQDVAPLVADDVSVESRLVTSFDAVAELPGGEPVRVRCREWVDNVVVRVGGKGVTIEQSKPRMEVVPVRFETY